MTAPLTQREFVEWFRDTHMIDSKRLQYIMTQDAQIIDLDRMTDDQARMVAEQFMMLESRFEGHA